MPHLHNDLRRDWRKWTRTERFSAVVIVAAMVTVIVPAAVEFSRQTTIYAPHHVLTRSR